MSDVIVGSFEHVSLPDFGVVDILAKVDTGAYSGALHCSRIVKKQLDSGKYVLEFSLFDDPKQVFTTDKFILKSVRSSSGHSVQRYVIQTTIVVKGQAYPIKVGLSNRSKMNCAILLGRRFLREHNIIVDVRLNQEYDKEMRTA